MRCDEIVRFCILFVSHLNFCLFIFVTNCSLSSVIYEVNISVDANVFDEFMAWLQPHMKELLALDGFEKATLFERVATEEGAEKDDSKKLLTCHYHVQSREHLQNYFDHHAARLRGDGMKRFEKHFQIERRILHEKLSFDKQDS